MRLKSILTIFLNVCNRIIHAYDAVDDNMIWEIVVKHLPLLKKEVEALLK